MSTLGDFSKLLWFEREPKKIWKNWKMNKIQKIILAKKRNDGRDANERVMSQKVRLDPQDEDWFMYAFEKYIFTCDLGEKNFSLF